MNLGMNMAEFNINDALAFLSVVDEGSFAAAGKKWSLSSSVMSKRISRLEENLRTQLLQRTTRSMILTEAGQKFYESCKRIRSEVQDAAADISEHHQKPSGLLRINSPMSFGQVHLMPAINDFVLLYPDIDVELILGSQYDSFIQNGLDLAIFIKDLPNTHLLKSRKITVRSNGVFGSPSYLSRMGLPLKPSDLTRHNCLVYQAEPGNQFGMALRHQWHFYRGDENFAIDVKGNLRVNSHQALVKSALAGIGLVKLSSFMVTDEVKEGRLISVLQDYCKRDVDIHAVYPSQHYLPSKVRVFLEFLTERFNSEAYWHKS